MKIVPTVYIVDDDETVLDATGLLVRSMGFEVKSFRSAIEFLDAYSPDLRGCLALDVRMPEMSGIELQRELINRKFAMPIIFITGHGDVPMAVEAMKLGAIDFLEKPYNDQQLLDNINKALELDNQNFAKREEKAIIEHSLKKLTPREHEVMTRVVAGESNKVIAIELGLSERTIEIHRSRVMSKMDCKSVAALVSLVSSVSS